jgi:1,4-dihydroxy-2-naphthoyl-CoA synthase
MTTVQVSSPRSGVALVTLDRPDRLNAMSHELVADLHGAFDSVEADNSARVVVLTCTDGLGRVPAAMVGQQHIASLVPKMRALRQPRGHAGGRHGLRREAATQVRGR